jgi:stearoyl-CoA desaturase (delta-9 desaturase)
MPTAVSTQKHGQEGPSLSSIWPTEFKGVLVLAWVFVIHLTAVAGLIEYPLPGWHLLLASTVLTLLGGAGATICYHRALAHRSLKLNPAVQTSLIFFAMLCGVTPPRRWIANHRFHHATADTSDDPSSPVWHGMWVAHVAWYWQPDRTVPPKYEAGLQAFSLRIWEWLLAPMFLIAFFGGAFLSLRSFFWLGAIRLVFTFHANSFVNSVCHTQPRLAPGQDSSRNVRWVGFLLLFLGENWHRNHHRYPTSARIGMNWREPDLGYQLILVLESLRLATAVRRPPGPASHERVRAASKL